MKIIIFFGLLFSVSAWSALPTTNPRRVDVSAPLGLPRDGLNQNYEVSVPYPVTLAVTSDSAWTATILGNPPVGDFFAGMLSASINSGGVGTTNTVLSFDLLKASVSIYTALYRITNASGSIDVQITVAVTPDTQWKYVAPKLTCTNTTQRYYFNDNCSLFSAASEPAVNSMVYNSAGSKFLRFKNNQTLQYSARNVWREPYVMLLDYSGGIHIYNQYTGVELGTALPGGPDTAIISPLASDSPGTYYYYINNTIWKNVPTVSNTQIADLSAYLPTGNNNAGGTSNMTSDGWLTIGAPDGSAIGKRMCAYDIPNSTPYCTAVGELEAHTTLVDYGMITEAETDGTRYLLVMGTPSIAVYIIKSGSMSYWFNFGQYDGALTCVSNCISTPHAATGYDESGKVILFTYLVSTSDNFNYTAAYRISDGPLTVRTRRKLGPEGSDNGVLDHHYTCNRKMCAVIMYAAAAKTVPTNYVAEAVVYDFTRREIRSTGPLPTAQAIQIAGESLSLVNASTSVTGVGTSWTSGFTGKTFYVDLGSNITPGYYFTYSTATSGTFASPFSFTTGLYNYYFSTPEQYYATPRCNINPYGNMLMCSANFYTNNNPSAYIVSIR